jgi:hypothetical protein
VKPTIVKGFDYRRMAWAHLPQTCEPVPVAAEAECAELHAASADLLPVAAPSIAPAH